LRFFVVQAMSLRSMEMPASRIYIALVSLLISASQNQGAIYSGSKTQMSSAPAHFFERIDLR
jgi:hypothetical protein